MTKVNSYGLTAVFFKIEERAKRISDRTHAYLVKDTDEIDLEFIKTQIELIRKGLDFADKILFNDEKDMSIISRSTVKRDILIMEHKINNPYKEWWEHFIRFYEQTKETYNFIVKHGSAEPFNEFIENIRNGWFKEMKYNE